MPNNRDADRFVHGTKGVGTESGGSGDSDIVGTPVELTTVKVLSKIEISVMTINNFLGMTIPEGDTRFGSIGVEASITPET